MKYLAHISDGGKEQTVIEHLERTGELAGKFAGAFGQEAYAKETGRGHDIGKFSLSFQQRIRGRNIHVDHSTAGAVEFRNQRMPTAALCVAGHHAGIPNLGSRVDGEDDSTLMGRLKRKLEDYSTFRTELQLNSVREPDIRNNFDVMLMTRMIFSALVDADFLDTEEAMADGKTIPRSEYEDMKVLAAKVDRMAEELLKPDRRSPINEKRCELLRCCLEKGEGPGGLYTYTAPTGSGKTKSSLAFAMKQAIKHNKDRIIYVVPYTSIIEQNAGEFRELLGDSNVLEHHANVCFDTDESSQRRQERWRLAAENWDKPVIVTTSEQFFESLFANRPSKCRKLHNIANSVVIFDEAQMLPVSLLKPCVRMIASLVRLFSVTAVLCTATQPALEAFWNEMNLHPIEISPDVKGYYQFFKRVQFEHMGRQSKEEIAERMAQQEQVLTVVSTRKKAKELYELLPDNGRFHLSTLMCPAHRRTVLENIRQRLNEGQCCRVISTSLIEAGVDVDFPVLFREEAGLDSLIQAAGRCNREGKAESGVVYVYESDERLPDSMKQSVAIFHEVSQQFEDISSPEAIHAYFDALYHLKDEELDEKEIVQAAEKGIAGSMLPFVQIAERFRMIDTQTADILVTADEAASEIARRLRGGEISREILRQAGPYLIHVYPQHFRKLWEAGDIEVVREGFAILTNVKIYSEETGISLEGDFGKAVFI